MPASSRRTIFKWIIVMPTMVSALSKQLFSTEVGATTQELTDVDIHENLGIRVLRLLTTAELWFYSENRRFAEISELQASNALQKLRSHPDSEKHMMGSAFIDSLAWHNPENICAGWQCTLQMPEDKSRYVIEMTDVSSLGVKSIWAVFNKPFGRGYISATQVLGGKLPSSSLDTGADSTKRAKSSLSLFLSSFLPAFDPGDGCCTGCCSHCITYPCCTSCLCQCMDVFVFDVPCWVCGCDSCVYCCQIY